MKDLTIRPFKVSDKELLLKWAAIQLPDVELDVPAFNGVGRESAVGILRDGAPICSLTATFGAIFDPFIKSPDAKPLDLIQALWLLTRHLECRAMEAGAVEAYCGLPKSLVDTYGRIVERCGYERITVPLILYRRVFVKPEILNEAAELEAMAAT